MKKQTSTCIIIFLFTHWEALVLNESNVYGAFVVTGNVVGLSRDEKTELHQLLTATRFPNLVEINKRFKKKGFFGSKGVEVFFVPDTSYQLIQLYVRDHEADLKDKFERFWMRLKDEKIDQLVKEHDQASTEDYFFRLNNAMVRFLDAKKYRFEEHSIEHLTALLPTHQFPSEVKMVLEKAISAEDMAYSGQKVLLWRFSNGIPNHPGWVDSILDMSPSQIREIVSRPRLFKSKALHANGLSFGRTLLDGYVRDGRVLEDPVEEYDSLGSPACSMAYLLTGLNHRQIINLYGSALERYLDEKGAVLSKDAIQQIHANRSSRTLYYLALSEHDLKSLEKFFMDPTDKNKFYLGLLGSGERFHYWLFLREKVLDKPDIHRWGASTLIGELDDPVTEAGSSLISESHDTKKHLIREYFKIMSNDMHILYTNHHVIGDETKDADSKTILENYRDFYRTKIPDLLNNF